MSSNTATQAIAGVTRHPAAVHARRQRRQLALSGAAAAGIVGDSLLRFSTFGSNLALYFTLIGLGVVLIARARLGTVPTHTKWLLRTAALFAAALLFRDADLLWFLNAAAVFVLLVLAAAPPVLTGAIELTAVRLRELATLAVSMIPVAALGPIRTGPFADESLTETPLDRVRSLSVLRAVALTLILTTGFMLLLAQGDPVFARAVSFTTNIDFEWMVQHVVIFGFFAWPVAGLLLATGGVSVRAPMTLPALPLRLSRLDVSLVLGALLLLFGLFVALQLRVLFGGMAYVQSITGLTLAEYARSGFFTLAFTAALTLALLLAIDATFTERGLGAWPAARRLAYALIACVNIVLVSAAARMWLYVQQFGLSLDRLYALAAIGCIGMVCAWFALTVLRGRSERFALGAAVAVLMTVATLNVASPDQLVGRNAIDRAQSGRTVDTRYLLNELSADATPLVASAIARGVLPLPDDAAIAACREMREAYTTHSGASREGWRWGRERARNVVSELSAGLRARGC